MPVVAATTFQRIEDLTEYWLGRLDDDAEELGFQYVGGYDDPMTTNYPAVHVSSGTTDKEIHGTHTFLMQWGIDFTIMHAQADETHRSRSKEMLQLVTRLVNFLENDYTLANKVIFGYVIRERAGVMRPRSNPSIFVVSTILTYQATAEVRFR